MCNAITADQANDAALRLVVRRLLANYDAEDFVPVFGEELSKYATDFARRTGNYDRASLLAFIAARLTGLVDDATENYDPEAVR